MSVECKNHALISPKVQFQQIHRRLFVFFSLFQSIHVLNQQSNSKLLRNPPKLPPNNDAMTLQKRGGQKLATLGRVFQNAQRSISLSFEVGLPIPLAVLHVFGTQVRSSLD